MPNLHSAAALILDTDLTRHDVHLGMIFIGIIAVSMMIAAVGVLVTVVFVAKLLHRVDGIACDVKERTGPILDKTNALISELSPKIHGMTTNVEQMSYTVRARVDELGETVRQMNETVNAVNLRTRVHISHVDGIVTSAIQTSEDVANTIQQGIKGPIKQVAGVLAGLRAGLEALIERSPFGR
jgi:uncharacterized protein YoxC